MSANVIDDLTDIVTANGIVMPQYSDFTPGVPIPSTADGWSIVELFRSSKGVSLDGSSKVQTWEAFNESLGIQADPTKRPAISTGTVSFAGSGEFLNTAIVPDASSGYIAVKLTRGATTGAFTAIIGQASTNSAPFQTLRLGITSTGKITAFIGTQNATSFVGTTTINVGDTVVISISWSGGTTKLRLNGAEEASATFNGGGAGVGTNPFWIGGTNNRGVFANESNDSVFAILICKGLPDNVASAAIDAAMALL